MACAQIIPWIESIYMWNNQLETTQESKIVLKTRLENYNKIREIIEQNSKYEVPEITWFKIERCKQILYGLVARKHFQDPTNLYTPNY